MILAEIRAWATKQGKDEALIGFREMLNSLLKDKKMKEKREFKYAKKIFSELMHINGQAE